MINRLGRKGKKPEKNNTENKNANEPRQGCTINLCATRKEPFLAI